MVSEVDGPTSEGETFWWGGGAKANITGSGNVETFVVAIAWEPVVTQDEIGCQSATKAGTT